MSAKTLDLTGVNAASRSAIRNMLEHPRFELIPLKNVIEQAGHLPEGATVTVTASPQKGQMATIDLALELQQMGFEVIPHISARLIQNRRELRQVLDRLNEASIHRAFVVGGDGDSPGEFFDGLSLLSAMESMGHNLTEIGIPGYPEGHPTIADDLIAQALEDKAPFASYITSQICFDSDAITGWVKELRADGFGQAVYLGIPGVAELHKLITISLRIGVGASAKFLSKNRSLAGQLVRPGGYGPDQLIVSLASHLADPAANIVGFHFYTFNRVDATEEWRHRMLEELV
ncbi:MAG: methylenetetrahydrofolate reductase [Acidimicrobiia bacterium]